uniref:Arp2/3 complex 34 kDa subunit n=1 Tax=Steinernema glaseri TaxID=37863 RepID=A0A1I8AEV9_9BILA
MEVERFSVILFHHQSTFKADALKKSDLLLMFKLEERSTNVAIITFPTFHNEVEDGPQESSKCMRAGEFFEEDLCPKAITKAQKKYGSFVYFWHTANKRTVAIRALLP